MIFIVDKDLINVVNPDAHIMVHTQDHQEGTIGWVKDDEDPKCILQIATPQGLQHRWQLRDDDNNVYFKGRATDVDTLEILDVLGDEYGCTSLWYWSKEDAKWIRV